VWVDERVRGRAAAPAVGRLALAAAAGALVSAPAGASAWWVADPLHANCHERISAAALADVGYVQSPPPLSADDAALRNGLQFDAGPYPADIYALSLIIGTRWPDSEGAPSFDFYKLSNVHNAAGGQGAHCLREETDVGAEAGDTRALGACRAAVTALYWQALATLDTATGGVDPDERTLQPEYLPFIGKTQIPVSGFYFFAGRALHAIQDSFTHSYRRMDGADAGHRITSIFNWSSQVRGDLNEAENGHGHETILDNCDDDNPSNADRLRWSTEASAAFLGALTGPGDAVMRQMRLDAFLADWMAYEPGCSIANEYCDNPVQAWLRASGESMNYDGGGCVMAGRHGTVLGVLAAIAAGGVALLRRRRRRREKRTALLALALVTLGASAPARADDEHRGWRAEARASFSVQNPAYAFGGAGAFAWRRAELGGFAELNPWYDTNRETMSLGATNFGVFTHVLHALRPDVRLRAGIGLGLSVLNQDLPGTSAGNVGVYANLRLLGIVWYFAGRTALTIDAFDLALPAPQLRGWPVLYAQHRFSIGLSF
jgi:hypothetical protein